jgi:Trypsin
VPANAQRLIRGLRAKVDVRVVQTRYSLATLNRDVLAAIRSGSGVADGYPMTDGSGIVLGVRSPNPRSVASALRSRFGVPVVATRAGVDHLQYCAWPDSVAPLGPGSRCNDWPDFWGGNVIQQNANPKPLFCTGGFGVHNSSGGRYLLTAAHCAYNGSGYVNGIAFYNGQDPANRQFIGYITDVPGPHDLAVIPTRSGRHIYDGPGIFNGDTYNTDIVAGQQATSVGDVLCESGAAGGTQCGYTVSKLNVSSTDQSVAPAKVWTGLAGANWGGNLVRDGDSGGPWFSLDGCCTYVWAKGIHHGLATLQGDPTVTLYETFTPITTATSDMGVWVNTG